MKNTKIIQNLFNFSGLTIISRVLGFVRDTIIARFFGVSIATDAFFVAFKLPNMLRRITAEGAFTQAFIVQGWDRFFLPFYALITVVAAEHLTLWHEKATQNDPKSL